ncbi:MAG: phosphoribosylformimino-5-aminoimidazole carboxamide ribotide isomerase [Bacteroidales bacterium]|nr:phosphoribosylformimino-5-aminoimidazole carboxamide ribotide isomerase [Lachnoclostridium sp.]MCM1385560.1 phosphoribosylformimino-5-aminoimidazole carboxamide ribotide isomerase [Lachnoclostridium sp.]MCM1466402.1 phosphoribosylformimino-5-aminoimidazole carboxamide ribotide isomerase [Bacteroidales bacterium]
MEFRPCIDIHNGKVKQIVGGSLKDQNNEARENFVAEQDAAFFARLYKGAGLRGGHMILLNAADSEYYRSTKEQALAALKEYPGGLQIGGGITPQTAQEYLEAGASHVIVTSYVFQDGRIHFDRLKELAQAVGKERLVLDVSCKKHGSAYLVVTDRWQKVTEEEVSLSLLEKLSRYCDEFLIHGVDVEGMAKGIEKELVRILGSFSQRPVTYAGGVHDFYDLELIKTLGKNRVNVTVGSALDLFGGNLKWEEVLDFCS